MEGDKNNVDKEEQQPAVESSPEETVTGLTQNLEALLCYVLGWITGLLFLILSKENKFVRFHAMQSLITFLALFIISFVGGMVPILSPITSLLVPPVGLILWIFLMYKAYQGERYELPLVGDIANEQLSNIEAK